MYLNVTLKLVSEWVEIQSSGDAEGGDQFWGGDETVGGRIGVITTCEVSVVRCDDGVLLALLDVPTIPLADAGSASVGQYLNFYLKLYMFVWEAFFFKYAAVSNFDFLMNLKENDKIDG